MEDKLELFIQGDFKVVKFGSTGISILAMRIVRTNGHIQFKMFGDGIVHCSISPDNKYYKELVELLQLNGVI